MSNPGVIIFLRTIRIVIMRVLRVGLIMPLLMLIFLANIQLRKFTISQRVFLIIYTPLMLNVEIKVDRGGNLLSFLTALWIIQVLRMWLERLGMWRLIIDGWVECGGNSKM